MGWSLGAAGRGPAARSFPWLGCLGGLVSFVVIAMGLGAASARSEVIPTGSEPVSTAAPTLSGTPTVGQTLSCSNGAWAGAPSGFSYVWLRDGSPIAGQTASTYVVQATDVGHSLTCRVTASIEAGGYTIIGLPTGSYTVSFLAGSLRRGIEVGNYLTTYFPQAFAAGEAHLVSVTAGSVTSGIDAAMPAGGEITGTVSDAATHAGVAGVDACAELGGRQEACTTTNAAGEYTLSGLPTGSYSIWFTYNSTTDFMLRWGWSWTEYYNGQASRAEANQVPVRAGSVTSGINVEMQTGQITGTVTSVPDKKPAAGVEVCAYGDTGTRACSLTTAAGEYTIPQLGPGSYIVQFASSANTRYNNYVTQFYDRAPSLSQAVKVTVTAGSATAGIDAELQTGGQIHGTVTSAATHTPLEGVYACTTSRSESESGPCTYTNSAGEYTLNGLATGSYQVAFSTEWEGASADYLRENFGGKPASEELGRWVAVSAGTMTSGIDTELTVGGQITGTVTGAATNAGVAGILACVRDTESRCAKTDTSGQYTLSGITEGSVHVDFVRFPGPGNYLSQLYAGQVTYSAATAVPVTAGAVTAGIDAQLLTGGQITGRVTSSTGAGIPGVTVCAEHSGGFSEAFSNQTWGGPECAVTSGAGGSANATSNALAVQDGPHSRLKLLKMRFDPHNGKLDFYFNVEPAGRLRWQLYFQNADIGFASTATSASNKTDALAETATRAATRKHKACRDGYVKHDGRCRPLLVALSSGTLQVHAGTVEVQVRPDALASRALRAHRLLHVGGSFTFQSSLGGPPATQSVATVAQERSSSTKRRR